MRIRWTLALSALVGLSLSTACGDDEPTSQAADTVAPADVEGDTLAATDVTADTVEPPPIVDIAPFVEVCDDAPALTPRSFAANIRWGSYGIPQITATDLPNVLFGQHYAMAKDHVCTMADQFVAVRSERALYFGRGDGDANVKSDFGWLALGLRAKARCQMHTMSSQTREALRAMAAGYNQYLADTGVANLPPACKDAAWVKPVSDLDVASIVLAVTERASGQAFLSVMATSQPPTTTAAAAPMGPMSAPGERFALADLNAPPLASNGWGIGKDWSDNGRGKLFANPHFPWEGALRLWESQLTVPGEINVHGVTLIGAPAVLIGFNEHLGWTHTVAASTHFSLYVLALDPSDPTVYVYDGERRRMARHTATIAIKESDGSTTTEERTFYASHFGPILSVSPLIWNTTFVLSVRDANLENHFIVDQWLAMDKATNFAEWKQAFTDYAGIPWVNTMYADAEGNAFYTDATPVPNMSAEAEAWWQDAVAGNGSGTAATLSGLVWQSFGAFTFDGSTSAHAWVEAAGAREPGLVPFSAAPQLARTDFVCNANDSHWLSNPAAPLTGYSRLYGAEGTERSYRTRMNLTEILETGDASMRGADAKFSFDELKGARTNGRALLAEMLKDDVVARCTGAAPVDLDGVSVPIADACAVLAAWDGTLHLDDAGGPLWREFVGALDASGALRGGFTTPFDAADAVHTPRGLGAAPAEGVDPVHTALATAITRLAAAGFGPDATLADAQYTLKGDERIAVPGGFGFEGAVNIVDYSRDNTTVLPKIPRAPVVNAATRLTEDGYLITYGTSFVMALEFTDDGPRADALLTYSQSTDPASPHFADQTRLFGEDGWRAIRFSEADIAADPNLVSLDIATD